MTSFLLKKPQSVYLFSGEGLSFLSVASTCATTALILVMRAESFVVIGSLIAPVLVFFLMTYMHWQSRMNSDVIKKLHDSLILLLLACSLICSVGVLVDSVSMLYWHVMESTAKVVSFWVYGVELSKAMMSIIAMAFGYCGYQLLKQTHDD